MGKESVEEIMQVNLLRAIGVSKTFLSLYEGFRRRIKGKRHLGVQDKSFCLVNVASLLAMKGGYGGKPTTTKP